MSATIKPMPIRDASAEALFDVSLEISAERDKTEREAIGLLKQGRDQEALRVLRKHWNIPDPKLRRVK